MYKISQEDIERVRDLSDIGCYSSIRSVRKGNNFFGLCPFHNEKHPFSVAHQKQIYHCF